MALELILTVSARSGHDDTSGRLRTITQNGAKDVGIEWLDPEKAVGISEHLYEMLGVIGVLSLPVSVFASVLANEISRIIHGMQEPEKNDDKISFTLADTDNGRSLHIEFSSRDHVVVEAVTEKIRAFLE